MSPIVEYGGWTRVEFLPGQILPDFCAKSSLCVFAPRAKEYGLHHEAGVGASVHGGMWNIPPFLLCAVDKICFVDISYQFYCFAPARFRTCCRWVLVRRCLGFSYFPVLYKPPLGLRSVYLYAHHTGRFRRRLGRVACATFLCGLYAILVLAHEAMVLIRLRWVS